MCHVCVDKLSSIAGAADVRLKVGRLLKLFLKLLVSSCNRGLSRMSFWSQIWYSEIQRTQHDLQSLQLPALLLVFLVFGDIVKAKVLGPRCCSHCSVAAWGPRCRFGMVHKEPGSLDVLTQQAWCGCSSTWFAWVYGILTPKSSKIAHYQLGNQWFGEPKLHGTPIWPW
jgi:hypothetical protein